MDSSKLSLDVKIKPTTPTDKMKIFDWLTNSNLTAEMLGEPKFPDNPIPSWKEFDKDYLSYYFDGTEPEKGRCFIIEYHDIEVGQINYNRVVDKTKTAEIDIWLADKKYAGRGIGTAAIRHLCRHLFEYFDYKKIIIQPSGRNINAIKSYTKAGFVIQKNIPKGFELEYYDSVFMVLHNSAKFS